MLSSFGINCCHINVPKNYLHAIHFPYMHFATVGYLPQISTELFIRHMQTNFKRHFSRIKNTENAFYIDVLVYNLIGKRLRNKIIQNKQLQHTPNSLMQKHEHDKRLQANLTLEQHNPAQSIPFPGTRAQATRGASPGARPRNSSAL